MPENEIILGRWEDIVPLIPSGSVNLVITDPPYQITPHLWDRHPDWNLFMSEMARVCGDDGQMWIFCRLPWSFDVYAAAKSHGFVFVQERIWIKQNGAGKTVKTFRKVHENIWHFKRSKASVFNLAAIREPKMSLGDKSIKAGKGYSTTQYIGTKVGYVDDGLRMPKSVVFCPNLHQSKESLGHPTQKPEAIIRPLILYSSNPGDMVLDPFCGTGTTLKVAKDEGRRWLGIEMTPKWHQKAIERLQQPAQAIYGSGMGKGTDSLFDEQ